MNYDIRDLRVRMASKAPKEAWGGNRPGAGRPLADGKQKKVATAFSLSPSTLKTLDDIAKKLGLSRSGAIERIIHLFKR